MKRTKRELFSSEESLTLINLVPTFEAFVGPQTFPVSQWERAEFDILRTRRIAAVRGYRVTSDPAEIMD